MVLTFKMVVLIVFQYTLNLTPNIKNYHIAINNLLRYQLKRIIMEKLLALFIQFDVVFIILMTVFFFFILNKIKILSSPYSRLKNENTPYKTPIDTFDQEIFDLLKLKYSYIGKQEGNFLFIENYGLFKQWMHIVEVDENLKPSLVKTYKMSLFGRAISKHRVFYNCFDKIK